MPSYWSSCWRSKGDPEDLEEQDGKGLYSLTSCRSIDLWHNFCDLILYDQIVQHVCRGQILFFCVLGAVSRAMPVRQSTHSTGCRMSWLNVSAPSCTCFGTICVQLPPVFMRSESNQYKQTYHRSLPEKQLRSANTFDISLNGKKIWTYRITLLSYFILHVYMNTRNCKQIIVAILETCLILF